MRLLFIHGAGGYGSDRPLAEALAAAVGSTLEYPEYPDSDMSLEGWVAPTVERLARLGPGDRLAAHSFGASILVHALARLGRLPGRVALLGMPDWSPAGWDVADYHFRGPEPQVALALHHCRDDDEVPFRHLSLNAAALPSARTWPHPAGGHQFVGLADAIAGTIRETAA